MPTIKLISHVWKRGKTSTQHYKYFFDADKRNAFNVEKYLARTRQPQPPVKPDEV